MPILYNVCARLLTGALVRVSSLCALSDLGANGIGASGCALLADGIAGDRYGGPNGQIGSNGSKTSPKGKQAGG
jgi:hypothetical protein